MNKTTSFDFVFEHLPTSWAVPFVLCAIIFVAWLSWKRYGPSAGGTAGKVAQVCRIAAMIALVLLIAGPAWRTTETTVLAGRVLVAVDRSASMAREDGPGGKPRIAAASVLARELAKRPDDKPLAIEYRTIGGIPGGLDADELQQKAPEATGSASNLGDDLARLVAEQRPDGLIVVSDGRVTAGSGLAALPATWRGRDISLSVLATGGESVEPELAIDEVQVNRSVALGEQEPVTVRFSTRALKPGPIKITVLVDGEPAATTEIEAPQGDEAAMASAEAQLTANFEHEGTSRITVIAEHGPDGDQLTTKMDMAVNVSERKLRVLILEYRPRYETRYLREAFKRDKTITVHTYLAEGRWRRWGDGSESEVGPEVLPLSPNALREYDVIIIGDIGPDTLREVDLQNIDTVVRKNAVGLVWLPGESGAISGFVNSKLGGVLPVELPDASSVSRGYIDGAEHRATRTTSAESHGLLDAGDVDWERLPPLLGASPVIKTIAGAEVLIEDQRQQPLVVSRVAGTGRTLFIGIDDTWRWRRNVGDRYLHRFHSQLLRYVAANRRLGNHAWRLFANPRRAVSGEPLTLNLNPAGGEDLEDRPDNVTVRLTTTNGQERLLRLLPEGHGFALRLPAPAPGTWTLELASGIDPQTVDSDQLLVLPPSDERRDPRLDQAALTALVAGVGGQYHTDPARLVADLPDLSRAQSTSTIKGWWDTWWALLLIVTLFAVDWSIRRINRLP